MVEDIYDLRRIANADKTTLGYYVCVMPTLEPWLETQDNKGTEINYTGPPGKASALYYSLFFQLGKWGWTVVKADEWIEVSPTHKEYYERTVSTKQMLESTIKTGLASAAQSVADFELMSHDMRKYKEIINYFNEKDEHSLKAMFVDQVDIHTDMPGQPLSMRSMAPKWSTIIADFIKLTDDDDSPEKVQKKLSISKAEGVILATKIKLYKNWKKTFSKVAQDRYEMLLGQVKAREKTIKEYREWLKPYIARFKMTKLGGERTGVRRSTMEAFPDITGISTFANNIRVFSWKVLKTAEGRRPAEEIKKDFSENPYDDYVRDNLILGEKYSLAKLYPWLRNKVLYCPKCERFYSFGTLECPECGSLHMEEKTEADKIVKEKILEDWKNRKNGLDPYEFYYLFMEYDVFRVGTRLPSGELEDITFKINTCLMSQNVLLVKLLELECRNREIENYIDEMLGIKMNERSMKELMMEEFPGLFPKKKLPASKEYVRNLHETIDAYTSFLNKMKAPSTGKFRFFKPGRYEKDFKERVSKNYSTVAGANFGAIVGFLKMRMGVQ